jgi:ParB/RepB/Spo0J family partition protein
MIKNYPLEHIRNNRYQARQLEDQAYILELAESIRDTNGVLQIPKGRPDPDNPKGVELALGHERLEAYKRLASGAIDGTDRTKWETMPVDVDELTDRQMFEFGIAENLHRRPLSAIETGAAMRLYAETFHATWTEVGRLFGYTQSAVSNLVRLQNLSAPIQAMVENHQLAERQARQLLAVEKIGGEKAVAIAAKVAAAPIPERDDVLAREIHQVLHGKDSRELDDEDGWNSFPPTWSDVSTEIPSCEDCPMRILEDTCVRPDCWGRKRARWMENCLYAVVTKTGIPAAAPGETVQSIPRNYENETPVNKAIKKREPFLRWMIAKENDRASRDYHEETGHAFVVLGTVDQKAWLVLLESAAKEHKKTERVAAKAEAADDPKARAKHEKEVREMREERGKAIRNSYDIDWIIRNAVELTGKKIQISAPAVEYLAETVSKHCHIYSNAEMLSEFDEEIAEALKAAEKKFKHISAREKLVLYLLVDEMGYGVDDRKRVVQTLAEIAQGLGVVLPKGWDQPPIHETEHNCWHCGKFGSADGHLLKAEIEDGWVVLDDPAMPDVYCPDCINKPVKKKSAAKPTKKAKRKK